LVLLGNELLLQISGALAGLYGIGTLISYTGKLPIASKLTIAGQGLLLSTILFTMILDNLSANVVFFLAIIVTVANIIVLGYETGRLPLKKEKMLSFLDEVLPEP
jgi:hypothetical protein